MLQGHGCRIRGTQAQAVSYNAPDQDQSPPAGAAMRTLVLLTMTILAVSACATIEGKKKTATFETAVFRYSKAIRWSEFGLADSMRRLPEGLHTAQPAEFLEHIKVTSYETLATSPVADGSEVRVTVRIVYYHNDSPKLSTLLDNQIWKYDADSHSWHITTPLPVFR
jgi:hypothetical protein